MQDLEITTFLTPTQNIMIRDLLRSRFKGLIFMLVEFSYKYVRLGEAFLVRYNILI